MVKCLRRLTFSSISLLILSSIGFAYEPTDTPPAIVYPESQSEPLKLHLSPNMENPVVKGRKLTFTKNKNIRLSISEAMLNDGTIQRDILNGQSPDKFITVFEFKLKKKEIRNAYFVRASFGMGGLFGANAGPSWIYTKTADSYNKIFEEGMADTIIFSDTSDYPIIKIQGGHQTRWMYTYKWNGDEYVQ